MPLKIEPERWNYQLPPREKLLQFGVEALSDAELLALFLRTGIPGINVIQLSQKLIAEFGSLYALMNANLEEFKNKQGIGVAKYAQLKAVTELSRRFLATQIHSEGILTNPLATRHFLANHLSYQDREIFMVLFLNNKNNVLHHTKMFSGTLTCVEVHPREIIREALKHNAAAIILAHNHPSGYAEPSDADKKLTELIHDACSLMEIKLLDHIVVGKGECISFAERGWL